MDLKVVCLAGGVGGAKLAHGLAQALPAGNLTIVVNTGDDFVHGGLTICPDLDTVMYTLAGVANPETGWGRANESWRMMETVQALQGPSWFKLGDQDLATHFTRSALLAQGQRLTQVTHHLCQALGITHAVLPMSDKPAPTFIQTPDGVLPFQNWFVEQQCRPAVQKVLLPEQTQASRELIFALEQCDVVVLAPSNPFVSLDPILNVYPIRNMVEDVPQAVVAISPIVGGQALKGPAAKMMAELGLSVSAGGIATYYDELLDGFVYDQQDKGTVQLPDLPTLCTNTIMHTPADRLRVAREVLAFAQQLLKS